MSRSTLLILLLVLAGCNQTDPYLRSGVWHPSGANEANLRAMVVVPSDLVQATPAARADGGLATAALVRLRRDQVRPLLDSGLAQITPVAGGSAPAAAAASGNSQ
jgi:type IV pilus biogenesis protein CpaD/CtpE